MSSTAQALSLPEILLQVLKFSDDISLTAAIRVNKLWFDIGTDVLWASIPCVTLTNASEQRRQLYASKVQHLQFNGDDELELHDQFKHLQFRALKSISLDAYRPEEGVLYPLRQYLQPSLVTFEIYGAELDEEFLNHLRTTCWRLQKILIENPGEKLTPAGFIRFISGYRSLQYMSFMYGMEELLSEEFLIHCASRDNLLELSVGNLVEPKIFAPLDNPFAALQTFCAGVRSASVASIPHVFRHLDHLELSVKDTENDVIGVIVSMTGLRRLKLRFDCDTTLSTSQILSLQSLTKLEGLDLEPGPGRQLEAVTSDSPLTDKDFENLISQLPALRHLCFEVQSNLTAVSLVTLGVKCPLLEECDMPHEFDMQVFMREAGEDVIFRRLKGLFLGCLLSGLPDEVQEDDDAVEQMAENVIAFIRVHFPKLETLSFTSSNIFSDLVEERIAT